MKSRKTLFSLILALCLCFALAMPVWAADDGIMPQTDGYYRWEVGSTTLIGTVEGSRILYSDYGTRHNAGEYVTMGFEQSLGVGIDGSISVNTINLNAALGFNISATFSFSKSLVSRILKQNEGVKGYYRVVYDRYKVVQNYTYILDGKPTNVVTQTKTVYIDKPRDVRLEFVYY